MRLLRSTLAIVLSWSLGAAPTLAQVPSIHFTVPSAAGPFAATGSSFRGVVSNAARTDSIQLSPSSALLGVPFVTNVAANAPPISLQAMAPLRESKTGRATPVQATSANLAVVHTAASKAVEGLDRADVDASSAKAGAQFATLTSEALVASGPSDSGTLPAGAIGVRRSGLFKSVARPASAIKLGVTQVFRDPERNKAFWLWTLGYGIFLIGHQMIGVALPYLVSSMTRNALHENLDARASNEAAISTMVDSNRSLTRTAFWVAQAFSYLSIPLFTRNAQTDGPRKLMVRTTFIRAGLLALIPALFFATGLMGVQASLLALCGLLAVQAFFQALTSSAEGASTTRIMGDRSVTTAERTKANSIITFIASALDIISPIIAGLLASLGPVMGKSGAGGAVVYSIYAGAVALSGFVWATIKMLAGPSHDASADKTRGPSRKGFIGTLKTLLRSIREGASIIFHDRMLRTMAIISMMASLFSDPLTFSVFPKYVEHLVLNNPGSLGAVMSVPGLGWLFGLLGATPMGNFAMVMVMARAGNIAAVFLIKPVTALLDKLGFKTEESRTVPFYVLAALEAPLFFLMINTPTLLGVIALYGLQALCNGFIGIALQGIAQKKLGAQKPGDISKILAVQALIGIGVAILSTTIYGFFLSGVAVSTLMTIAAIAIGAMGLLRLAAPFLAFSKETRDHGSPDKK